VRLSGYLLRIALPQDSPKGPGWATVTPRQGTYVPGARYHLHEDDLDALDEYEGYPGLYLREDVTIETESGPETAMIYRMREPLRSAPPTPEYEKTLRRGYRDFELNEEILEAALRIVQTGDG
jgi:hypothetical protein